MKALTFNIFPSLFKTIMYKIHHCVNLLQGNIKERKEDLVMIKGINKIGQSLGKRFNELSSKPYVVTFHEVSTVNNEVLSPELSDKEYIEVSSGFYAIVCNDLEGSILKLNSLIEEEKLNKLTLTEISKIETIAKKMLDDSNNFLMVVLSRKGAKIYPHYHLSNEYIYVVRGKCRNKLTNSVHHEHSLFMYTAFEIHSLETISDKLILLASLDGK